MLVRHDFVTPYVDGIRFFDKPPLLYWLAAGSMHLFGVHAWAARLPLALITLALLLATYALGLRLFPAVSPAHAPDRAALYSTLALGTCIGPYLYTRFYIPDIALTLWTTLAIHLFLGALDRVRADRAHNRSTGSTLAPMLGFAAVLALSVLTKGLVGLVFPIGFALLFLLLTRRLPDLRHLHLPAAVALFFALAAPWHILAAIRNPAIPMPPGLGLPPRAGWAWFYLYNEHIARFFSRRIPHDYGQVPIPLFLLLGAVWLLPWAAFLPGALHAQVRHLRTSATELVRSPVRSPIQSRAPELLYTPSSQRETALTLLLWTALVVGFFTLSARQEYYSLPALPALALMIGALLARADTATATRLARADAATVPRPAHATTARPSSLTSPQLTDLSAENASPETAFARRSVLRAATLFLLPFGSIAALIALVFAITAPRPAPHTDIATLLAAKGGSYNLSLSHVFDLTGTAMGLFRGPLVLFALSKLGIGPASYLLRRAGHTFPANLTLAAASTLLLLSMHAGLVRFYPVLGTEQLAEDILAHQRAQPRPNDLIVIDGELTAGSTLLFYTRQSVSLLDGRINGPWFGSFWPDAPALFETPASLHAQWSGPRRVFLLTYHPRERAPELQSFGPVLMLSSAGGKALLSNRP